MATEDFANPNYVLHFQRDGGVEHDCKAPGPDAGLYASLSQRAGGVSHGVGLVADGMVLENGRLVTEVSLSDRQHRRRVVLEIVTRRDPLPEGQTGDPADGDHPRGVFLVLPNGTRVALDAALDALQQALAVPAVSLTSEGS